MFTLLIFYGAIALGFSFFCSIAESVILSITPSYIEELKNKRKPSGKLLEHLKARIDRPLAAILTLNTIAHTAGAAGVGAEAAKIWGSQAVGIASALMTLVILICSEIIPKTLGAVHWRALAPTTGRTLKFLIVALYPFVRLSEFLTWMLGGDAKKTLVTREEVAAMASLSETDGQLHQLESKILKNLLQLRSIKVRDVMTPRTVILAFPEELTVAETMQQNSNLPVSRLPIFRDDIDHVTGFVLKTDLLKHLATPGLKHTPLKKLRRVVISVPDTATLPEAMETLMNKRQHLALVVGEHGGTEGLVTMEDLIESLLGGEIVDESDRVVDMRKYAIYRWRQRARKMGIRSHQDAPS